MLGIAEILKQLKDGKPAMGNVYAGVVRAEGNVKAQKIMDEFFEVADVNWRGIGNIPGSGLEMREEYSYKDTRKVSTPRTPKGPCMVSMEGSCNIWFKAV